jgi:photosystem II stability/assembly factor-like uncharacterized protein
MNALLPEFREYALELGHQTDQSGTHWRPWYRFMLVTALFLCLGGLFLSSAYAATADLRQQLIDGIDSRIAGFSTSPSSFRSLWITRGNGSGGWQYNTSTLWSNQGGHALDFSGASPWNSAMGYNGAGTLISPRHLLFATHYTPANGSVIVFVEHDNQVLTRTLVNRLRIGSTDMTIGVLDADVPNSIAYYPLVSHTDFQRYLGDIRVPIIRVNQTDTLFIQNLSAVSSDSIATTSASGSRAPYTTSGMVSGDSGNPNFAVIGDQLILLGAHYTPNSFPNAGNYFAEINAAMASLGGGYQVTQLDLSAYSPYVPPSIPNQSMNVLEQAATGTVVGMLRTDGVNGMSALQNFQITAGDPNGAFTMDGNTGVITVNRPAILDYQLVQSFALTVSVQDSDSPPTLASGTVNVAVNFNPTLPHQPVAVNGVYAWTERANLGPRGWSNIAASAQGNELVAVDIDAGSVWISPDSGATWMQQLVLGTGGSWVAEISADGTHLIAADYNGPVWTATTVDGGVTWSWTQRDVQSHSWYSLALSADGARIVAVATDGAIFTSPDGGTTWIDRSIAGKDGWDSVVSSPDGLTLAAGSYNGYLLTSSDAGATWTDRSPPGAHYWASIAASSDGTKLAAIESGGYIYTSDDAGRNWTTQMDAGFRSWSDIAISPDGNRLAAVDYDGYIHMYAANGADWAAQAAAGARSWTSVALASNGGRLIAAAYGGSIWSGALPPSITTEDATSVISTGGFLNGAVNDIGISPVTQRGFQFGLTTSYGLTVTENGSFGPDYFSASIGSLNCGQTYHMRSYATNSAGTTYGADRTFSLPCPAVLTYTAGSNGSIAGTSPQSVEIGQDGTTVTAIPNQGFHFVDWNDGSTANPRTDANIQANIAVTASFQVNPPPTDNNPPGSDSTNADAPLPPWATGLLMLLIIGALLQPSGIGASRALRWRR